MPTDQTNANMANPNFQHQMAPYTWGIGGGSGLRHGFKCTCGWYVSENDAATAEQHLEAMAKSYVMNRKYMNTIHPTQVGDRK